MPHSVALLALHSQDDSRGAPGFSGLWGHKGKSSVYLSPTPMSLHINVLHKKKNKLKQWISYNGKGTGLKSWANPGSTPSIVTYR